MQRTLGACEPVTIVLLDKKEHKFLLTRGALRKIRTEAGVANDVELFKLEDDAVFYPILRYAHQDGELTNEELDDLIPADKMWCAHALAGIFGAAFPDPVPTPAGTALAETPPTAAN